MHDAPNSREYVTAGYAQIEPVFRPWIPRPKKILLTDSEQSRINREVDDALHRRCGSGHSPCRSLSREEIEALWARGEITPLEDIKETAQDERGWHLKNVVI